MELNTLIIVLGVLLVFGIVVYAILDGFDLGIGNMFLLFEPEERGKLMDTIAPVWDGNETWLIYVGTIALACFPVVFYGILPAIYMPAILMVAGLFIRGLSFELRLKAEGRDKRIWDFTFFLGSFLTSFLQGVLFATAFTGLNLEDGVFNGGVLHFLTPFNLLCGVLTVVIYSILGLAYLRYKTEGKIALRAVKFLKPLVLISFIGTFVVEAIIFKTTPQIKALVCDNTFRYSAYIALSLSALILLFVFLRSLKGKKHTGATFLIVVSLFATSLLKKVVMFWPFIIFPNYTIFTAANSEPALRFTFILLMIFLPMVLLYTGFVYFTFKGKIGKSDSFYS